MGAEGIHNNQRPLQNENPTDYANRCSVQWHRVSVYPQRLGNLVANKLLPGSLLYVEGNLETKVFADPITGLVRKIREVAVRQNGIKTCFYPCGTFSKIATVATNRPISFSGDMTKLLLAAKKIRKATCTEFLISLIADDFSQATNTYMGKLRSDFLGTKFMILDGQPPHDSSLPSHYST